MKLKPVHAYDKPRYPELSRENEASVKLLLKRRMPARWKRLTASAAMLCATAGIAEAAPVAMTEVVVVDAKPAKDAPKQKASITVAPLAPEIAAHGRGGFGCVAVSPPVYLSEDEAKEIIFDELAKAGIHLGPGVKLVRKASDPASSRMVEIEPEKHWDVSNQKVLASPEKQTVDLTLPIDWSDPEKGVAIELLTVNDGRFWGDVAAHRANPEWTGEWSSAYGVDLGKGAALMGEVVGSFESDRDLAVGIFATPLMKLNDEERQMKFSFYKELYDALDKAAPFPSLGPNPDYNSKEYKEAMDEYSQKRNEFWNANQAMRDEAKRKYDAYIKEIGKTGELQLRAQVKHFVKWLEEQEK